MKALFLGLWCFLQVIIASVGVYGQRVSQYHLEAGSLIATDQTPFWLRANKYGTIPLQNPIVQLNAGLKLAYHQTDSTGHRPKSDWGYGVDVIANVGASNQFLLPEAYLKGRFGAFELYAGRRKEIVGIVDTLLTTGAYAWSGNALPIPKIQIGLPAFTPIPLTKGFISVLGAYSHGWFENADRLVKGSYLHQKYVYVRLGKPNWQFKVYTGFNHQVIWAGYAEPNRLSPVVAVNGQLPSGLRYYPAVILGTRGLFDPNDKNVTSFEDNRIGNHLGSLDVAIEVALNQWNLLAYRQFVYDDGSLFYGTNLDDGLNGLRLKNTENPDGATIFLRQITFEYLFTGSQGGDEFVINDPQRRGRDNYFNHSQFQDGWTYFGRTIGTPFMTAYNDVRSDLPNLGAGIANSRVSVYHLGLSALVLDKVDMTARLSYGQNAGIYALPYVTIPKQFSGLLTASIPLNVLGGTMLNGSFAIDAGGLLPNSVGAYVGLRKTGVLSGKSSAITSSRRGF